MRRPPQLLVLGVVALAGLAGGCSSGSERADRGLVAVRVAATGTVSGLHGGEVTISGIEIRGSDGDWIPVETGLPKTVDLLALSRTGDTVTLPPKLVLENHYVALQIRINELHLAGLDGREATLAPHAAGWTVQVPVDFGVLPGGATIVALRFDLANSLSTEDGEYEFEPDIDVERVERADAR